MEIKLVSHTEDPVLKMASAAAITRGLTIDDVKKKGREYQERILKHVYEAGHWAVFEFADFDFQVVGASRVFEAQANRSRHMSPMWESGRHDQEYHPADVVKDPDLHAFINAGIDIYDDLLNGQHPEDARYALPQGVARKGRLKRNFRNLMETAMIRLCTHAQKEYRDFMWEIKKVVADLDPFLGEFLQPKCQVNLFCDEMECCGYKGALPKSEVKELIEDYQLIAEHFKEE